MPRRTGAEQTAIRVTSAALDSALISITAQRISDGLRVLVLRDSLTIREGKEHTAVILGKPWHQVRSNAQIA
jgi:hypothetical protein